MHATPAEYRKVALCALGCFLTPAGCTSNQGRAAMSCQDGYFRCGNGACVNTSLTCNGVDDCVDGTDEDRRYAECGDKGVSSGLVAAIIIGSIVGIVVLCCWVGSIIECIQHVYKNWCFCCCRKQSQARTASSCHSDMRGGTVTTVIANHSTADSAPMMASVLPPSYSSIFCNDATVIQLSSLNRDTRQNTKKTANAAVQVDLIRYDVAKSVRWL